MAQPGESISKYFFCSCQKEPFFKHEIINHLKHKATHKITKIPPQYSDNFNKSILKRIAKLSKTQIQIQTLSIQLIQIITQNTSLIIQKLSNIINLYRHLILNPPEDKEFKNFEIINTFQFNPSIFDVLTKHFGQQPAAERTTIDVIVRNVKSQVINIRINHVGGMQCMAVFSDEKRIVTGGRDGAIRVWDLETKTQIWFSLKHKAWVSTLALGNTDDLLLTGSADTSVRLWNLKLKSQIHKFVGHHFGVTCVLFCQDQSTGFSGSSDQTIRSWNLIALTPQRTIPFQASLLVICLIKKEKIIVASQSNGSISFFNFKNNRHSNMHSHNNFAFTSICFTSNEEQFITGSVDGTVEAWHTNGFKIYFVQRKHSAQITSIKISNCSKLFATGSEDETAIVWDLTKLQTIRLIQYQSGVGSIYFVKNSSSLLICSAYEINWCSLSTFVNQEKIKPKPISTFGISSDLIYAAYGCFRVCLIDIRSKVKVTKSSYIKQNIICLKFSPNNAFLGAGCFGGEITILSIPNLVQLQTLYTKLSIILCLSFSKSNELIGFGDGRSVKIISIKTKTVLYENEGKVVSSFCFCSNDEKFIYSDLKSIFVLGKDLCFLAKINFINEIKELFGNEDSRYVLVNHFNNRLGILKVESLEKIIENENRKFVKEWCTRMHDIATLTHLSVSVNAFY